MKTIAFLIVAAIAFPAAAASGSAPAGPAAPSAGSSTVAPTAPGTTSTGTAPVLRSGWTLKQPKKKPAQVAVKEGPALPPPDRQRIPAARRPKPATTPDAKPKRVNIAPMVAKITNKRN